MILAYNDSEIPAQTCPTCGRPYELPLPAAFDLRASSALDWIEILTENLTHLKAAIEEAKL